MSELKFKDLSEDQFNELIKSNKTNEALASKKLKEDAKRRIYNQKRNAYREILVTKAIASGIEVSDEEIDIQIAKSTSK